MYINILNQNEYVCGLIMKVTIINTFINNNYLVICQQINAYPNKCKNRLYY